MWCLIGDIWPVDVLFAWGKYLNLTVVLLAQNYVACLVVTFCACFRFIRWRGAVMVDDLLQDLSIELSVFLF